MFGEISRTVGKTVGEIGQAIDGPMGADLARSMGLDGLVGTARNGAHVDGLKSMVDGLTVDGTSHDSASHAGPLGDLTVEASSDGNAVVDGDIVDAEAESTVESADSDDVDMYEAAPAETSGD
jgi:hypothetical protein